VTLWRGWRVFCLIGSADRARRAEFGQQKSLIMGGLKCQDGNQILDYCGPDPSR
jgi:hypothetical protein